MSRPWRALARPKQIPPPGSDWSVYLVTAGRGWGKGWSASNWLAEQAATKPGTHWVVVAPTWRCCRKTCFPGLLRALTPEEVKRVDVDASELVIELTNGSTIHGFSAGSIMNVELGDASINGAWVDEIAVMQNALDMWRCVLSPAMVEGAQSYITTTPRPIPLLIQMVEDVGGSVIHETGSTWENVDNLSPRAVEELRRRYEGTRIGRQELEGEVLPVDDYAEGFAMAKKKVTTGVFVHRPPSSYSSLGTMQREMPVELSGDLVPETDERGVLRIHNGMNRTVAVFAPGYWSHVELIQQQELEANPPINVSVDGTPLRVIVQQVVDEAFDAFAADVSRFE